jgi:hypothetical protein
LLTLTSTAFAEGSIKVRLGALSGARFTVANDGQGTHHAILPDGAPECVSVV